VERCLRPANAAVSRFRTILSRCPISNVACCHVLHGVSIPVYAHVMAIASSNTGPATTGRVLHRAAQYDVLLWLFTHGRSRAFRRHLVDLAHLAPRESVLDVGCGTGSVALVAKQVMGASGTVVGIDASPAMIERAAAKAAKAGIEVSFETAVAEALPFRDGQFDVALSTLMLHHLPRKVRQQCLREIRRVLKPDGRVLVVDFADRQRWSGLLGIFHRHGHVDPGDVRVLLDEAGLRCVESGPVGFSSLYFVRAVPA
jgi:ubiquinone/menaquinone biosynthesis C-methylase UbiE